MTLRIMDILHGGVREFVFILYVYTVTPPHFQRKLSINACPYYITETYQRKSRINLKLLTYSHHFSPQKTLQGSFFILNTSTHSS